MRDFKSWDFFLLAPLRHKSDWRSPVFGSQRNCFTSIAAKELMKPINFKMLSFKRYPMSQSARTGAFTATNAADEFHTFLGFGTFLEFLRSNYLSDY